MKALVFALLFIIISGLCLIAMAADTRAQLLVITTSDKFQLSQTSSIALTENTDCISPTAGKISADGNSGVSTESTKRENEIAYRENHFCKLLLISDIVNRKATILTGFSQNFFLQ